jgi:hypothetical protein
MWLTKMARTSSLRRGGLRAMRLITYPVRIRNLEISTFLERRAGMSPRAGLSQIEQLGTGDLIGVPSRTPCSEAIEGPGMEVTGAPARVDSAIGVPSRVGSSGLISVRNCKSINGNPSRRTGDNLARSAVCLEAPEVCRFLQSTSWRARPAIIITDTSAYSVSVIMYALAIWI